MEKDIILIDKPKGITSFDCIRILRKQFGNNAPKMGHAGTLDPLATGLMIVGVGAGTKKLNDLLKLPKEYEVDVLIGEKRTTGDMEGEIVEEKEVINLNCSEVENALLSMFGKIKLPVPVYSAVKIKGKPLYKRARLGENIIPPIKEMEIMTAKLKSCKKEGCRYILEIVLKVASGTYIRSIAEGLGKRLGYPATVKELRRTRIGNFDVKNAKTFDQKEIARP